MTYVITAPCIGVKDGLESMCARWIVFIPLPVRPTTTSMSRSILTLMSVLIAAPVSWPAP